MLLEQGAKPKEIQARLGHYRLATTMDTYTHVTKKMKKIQLTFLKKCYRIMPFDPSLFHVGKPWEKQIKKV